MFDICDTGPQPESKLFFSTALSYLKLWSGWPHLNDSVALLHLHSQVNRDLLEIAEIHISVEQLILSMSLGLFALTF